MAEDHPQGLAAGVSSTERYRHLVEHSGDAISTHRPGDWAYTSINPALESMSGYSAAELLGRPAYELFHPDDAEAMKNKTIPAIYKHGVRTFRYRSRDKNNVYGWMESTHRSIRDRDGQLLEIIAVTRDITEQVKAEEATKRLASVVEASFAMILFCNRDHQVTYMNQALTHQLDLRDLPPHPHLKQLLGAETYERIADEAFNAASQQGNWTGTSMVVAERAPGRHWRLEEVIAHPRPGQEGDSYSLIMRDVTEQRQIEESLRDHQAELIHVSRLMTVGEMASGLAHEINQPLATSLNYARGAIRQIEQGRESASERIQDIFRTIIKQTQHAADIIKRVRSLIRKTPYQRRQFDLKEVCEEVTELLGHELWQASATLQIDAESESHPVVGDRIQIEQVVLNIVRNSVEALKERQRDDRCVHIELSGDKREQRVCIRDQAGGIDQGVRDSLFEPYVTSKESGLGMGLSIARSIAEAHGGRIEVDTDGEQWSTFTVVLPRAAI